MALTQQDKLDIQAAIAAGMKGSCLCGLSGDAQEELSHFMGMVKDLGKGNRAAGIETMRSLLKWWAKFHRHAEKMGVAIVYAATLTIVGALLGLLWIGFKVKLGK